MSNYLDIPRSLNEDTAKQGELCIGGNCCPGNHGKSKAGATAIFGKRLGLLDGSRTLIGLQQLEDADEQLP